MFSSQADIVCLIVPAVWVEELERAWKMQETENVVGPTFFVKETQHFVSAIIWPRICKKIILQNNFHIMRVKRDNCKYELFIFIFPK